MQNLNRSTMLTAANGRRHSALAVFTHALRYFREHAVRELADQSSTSIVDDDIRWVITVPAIWRPAAKQFMRQAAIEVRYDDDQGGAMIRIFGLTSYIYTEVTVYGVPVGAKETWSCSTYISPM